MSIDQNITQDIDSLPQWARERLETATVLNKALEDLAQDHGWRGEQDKRSLPDFLAQELRASVVAATCQSAPTTAGAPLWGCYECGFSGPRFKTLVQGAGAFEAQCPSCGSTHVDEAAMVLRELVATVEGLRERQGGAEACATAGLLVV